MIPLDSSRRAFVRALTLGGAAGLIGRPSRADAQDPEKPERDPEVEARMSLILARYGDHLDDEAREAIWHDVEGVVERGRRLREIALENGDEPFPIFRPYREPLS